MKLPRRAFSPGIKAHVVVILHQFKVFFNLRQFFLHLGHNLAICEVAKEGDFSYIVIGSRGLSGFSELLLGSASNRVAHCAETNVIVIK